MICANQLPKPYTALRIHQLSTQLPFRLRKGYASHVVCSMSLLQLISAKLFKRVQMVLKYTQESIDWIVMLIKIVMSVDCVAKDTITLQPFMMQSSAERDV